MSNFNPNKFLMDLKGKKYLPVSARIVWFRMECPDWSIVTTPVQIDMERNFAIFSAEIRDTEGRTIATGHKMETMKDFGDFLEKAETGSIGRALALCGFGTQFAPDFDEGTERIVDAPQPVREPSPKMPTVDPALVAARKSFAARANVLGYSVKNKDDIFDPALSYAVYAGITGKQATTATVADWEQATENLQREVPAEGIEE